ncbi:MAG: hypothetical protein ABIQ52_06195 [Vicinamibacterales bacterium]
MTSRFLGLALGLSVFALAGCEAAKSSNPTSPTVAGPIPGVNISAPALIEPAQGVKFKENEQPIRLVVQNATSNGVRALSYTFEVAADSSFNTKVYSRSGVAPGEGRTSVQVDRLDIGRAYYWRAWAEDGANTGASATAGFEIYPKPAVTPPGPITPVNNEVVASATPSIRVSNASWVGPVGRLAYEFQVAADQSFGRLLAAGIVAEGNSQTTFNSSALTPAATIFWRVRASDGETTSAWSTTQAFRTPAPPAPTPTPTPTPTPGGGGGTCALPNGPAIIACISNKYASKRAPVGSLGERQANMMFLRDRIIEAGQCAGMNYGWNLKRGGPELSIDVIAWKRPDGNMGVDVGFDYDNYRNELKLVWSEVDLFASWTRYTGAFSCGGV